MKSLFKRPRFGPILVFLMVASVALVACGDNTATPQAAATTARATTAAGQTTAAGGVAPATTAPAGAGAPAAPPAVSGTPVKTASGLQYLDVKPGEGTAAKEGQVVVVNYSGYLSSNGKKFDSSLDRNEPFSFKLGGGQVIKGWDEGVAGMKPGGSRRLIIPAALGYGSQGAGNAIPPNSELLFDVDMLAALDPAPATLPAVNGTPTKTASGLQYIDLKPGTGAEAKTGQSVLVHYAGYLANGGKKFDSSLDRGQMLPPFQVGAGRVIKGWDEGLVGMKVGGKRRLIIPAALGYGAQGAGGGTIPPNADLVFDVDLFGVK